MKKKVFSFLTAIVICSSLMSVSSSTIMVKMEDDSNFCQGVGLDAVDSWENEHGCLTAEEATDMYNRWYAACEVFGFAELP